MTESFFRSYELNPDQPPKIRMYKVGGEMKVEWDREDPELIAAGINDITAEEWGEITAYMEAYYAATQPVMERRKDGTYWIEPGKEPVLMPDKDIKRKKGFGI